MINKPIFGVTGLKNSGKTHLVERLVKMLTQRGLRVATVKHAHHDFDIDHPGTDSFRHRMAGARDVAISSQRRWALVHELSSDEEEPSLLDILARIDPCDLVIVEGYKKEPHPKIEVRRMKVACGQPLFNEDPDIVAPNIVAIAADHMISDIALPLLDLNATDDIADFILAHGGLAHGGVQFSRDNSLAGISAPERQDKPLADCPVANRPYMRHDEALALMAERIESVTPSETVPLTQAHGRVLAQSIIAPCPVPAHDNAAVDGYAFAYADHLAHDGCLPVTQRIPAGQGGQRLNPGSAARIFTGAPMPDGADTVVMQEDVSLAIRDDITVISIPSHLKRGANRRLSGEDLQQGGTFMTPGTRLRPQDVAAIASVGLTKVDCHVPVRVALASTGDEIVKPGTPLEHGQVHDSNYALLDALLARCNVRVSNAGILPDRADVILREIERSAAEHDLVITTGGVSQGEEDHVANAIDTLGKCHIWQLAIKPGRPFTFGQIGDCVCLGLPGNPVAAMVCFLLYAWPIIGKIGGEAWRTPRHYTLPSAFDMRKKTGRREFMRGVLINDKNGQLRVDQYRNHGSGLISSLRAADGLIEIPEEFDHVHRNDPVSFIPFANFGIL